MALKTADNDPHWEAGGKKKSQTEPEKEGEGERKEKQKWSKKKNRLQKPAKYEERRTWSPIRREGFIYPDHCHRQCKATAPNYSFTLTIPIVILAYFYVNDLTCKCSQQKFWQMEPTSMHGVTLQVTSVWDPRQWTLTQLWGGGLVWWGPRKTQSHRRKHNCSDRSSCSVRSTV